MAVEDGKSRFVSLGQDIRCLLLRVAAPVHAKPAEQTSRLKPDLRPFKSCQTVPTLQHGRVKAYALRQGEPLLAPGHALESDC